MGVPLMEQALRNLPEHLCSSPRLFYGVRVAESLVFCVVCRRSLCFCPFFCLNIVVSVLLVNPLVPSILSWKFSWIFAEKQLARFEYD
jgi:hypothetical protein